MTTLSRRLHRLEKLVAPSAHDEEESPLVALLKARRRRRLEAAGEPFEADEPRQRFTAAQCREISLADVLSDRYRQAT